MADPNAGVVEAPNVVEPALEPNAGAAVKTNNLKLLLCFFDGHMLDLNPNLFGSW